MSVKYSTDCNYEFTDGAVAQRRSGAKAKKILEILTN